MSECSLNALAEAVEVATLVTVSVILALGCFLRLFFFLGFTFSVTAELHHSRNYDVIYEAHGERQRKLQQIMISVPLVLYETAVSTCLLGYHTGLTTQKRTPITTHWPMIAHCLTSTACGPW